MAIKIDDAGDELSFKRKGLKASIIKGRGSSSGYINWETKKLFEKKNPDSVIDFESIRDHGIHDHALLMLSKWYKSIPPFTTSISIQNNDNVLINLFEAFNNEDHLHHQYCLEYLKEKYDKHQSMLVDTYVILKEFSDLSMNHYSYAKDTLGSTVDSDADTLFDADEQSNSIFLTAIKDTSRKLVDILKSNNTHNRVPTLLKRSMAGYSKYIAKWTYTHKWAHTNPNSLKGKNLWKGLVRTSGLRSKKKRYDEHAVRPELNISKVKYEGGSVEIPDIHNEMWPQFMVDTFGLKGIEFGIWNRQNERLKFIHECYTGLMELSRVLNIPPHHVGFGGKLGLAIGARGRGNASAHFMSVSENEGIINLTRKKGAGSLAHEYGHAQDFFSSPLMTYNTEDVAKDPRLPISMVANDKGRIIDFETERLNADKFKTGAVFNVDNHFIGNDYQVMMDKITEDKKSGQEVLNKLWKSVGNSEYLTPDTKIIMKSLIKQIVKTPRNQVGHNQLCFKLASQYLDLCDEACIHLDNDAKKYIQDISMLIYELTALKNDTSNESKCYNICNKAAIKTPAFLSNWVNDAMKLDQNKSKKYWNTPKELWARAFETYIYDKLQANGITHQALVNGVSSDDYPEGLPSPYASGKEREYYNQWVTMTLPIMNHYAHEELDIKSEVKPISFYQNTLRLDDGIQNDINGVNLELDISMG